MNNKYDNQKEQLLCSSANMWSAWIISILIISNHSCFIQLGFPLGCKRYREELTTKQATCPNPLPTFLRCTCLSLKMIWPSSFQRGRKQPPKTIEVPALWLSQSQNTWLALFQLMEDAWVPSACILLRILLIVFPPHIFQATLLPKKCKRIPQNHWARTLGKERKLLPLLWIILATSYQIMT